MINTRHIFKLSALSFGLTLALSALPAQAALPLEINGQAMPSLAPVVEQVTPAVVNISVSGKKVTRQEIPATVSFLLWTRHARFSSSGTTVSSIGFRRHY